MQARGIIVAAVSALVAGCSASVTGFVVPGERLEPGGAYYIVFTERDDHGLHELLRKELSYYRPDTSSGFADRMPAETDYLVEYDAQWQWDITWYLLVLSVRIYDPATRLMIATASSTRTSGARTAPDKMVAEALAELFSDELSST